jgi:sulfate permease, SulP family
MKRSPMPLKPKIITALKHYDRKQLVADLFAGSVVGIVAIPLALAFAIASGVAPEKGLATAIVAGFLISLLGGSRVQIGGPTGAFVVIVYGIVQQYGLEGLTLCTLLAGLMLIAMGVARLGAMIKFIPYPVTTGFTSGIAVVIFSAQFKDLLGLQMGALPPEFLAKWHEYWVAASTFSGPTLALSAGTLAVLMIWPRVSRQVPAPVVALVAGTAAAALLHLPVETIGSRFGELPSSLPAPSLPSFAGRDWALLIRPSVTVALLAAIESLLSAVVSDGMIGGRHRSDMELIAQGAANIGSAVFGGIPATGAIARTATNVKCGGRTPVAGMTHALVLALCLWTLGRWVALVPLCVLACILVVVSYHMSEWRSFATLLKAPRSDVAILLATFLLTVLVDLTVAVEVGMVMAAFLFMRRMAEITQIDAVTREFTDREDSHQRSTQGVPPGIQIYDINGPFFFGAAGKLRNVMNEIQSPPQAFILRMSQVPFIDATGLQALGEFQRRCRKQQVGLVLSGVQPQVLATMKNAGVLGDFDRVLPDPHIHAAVHAAAALKPAS